MDAQRRSDDARQSLLRQTLQRSRDVRRAASDSLFQRDLGRSENRAKKSVLSGSANKILEVLRKEWEMGTSDLRQETGNRQRARV